MLILYQTEHNQGKIPERVWTKLRQVSDDLCRKYGLSIIDDPELSKGKSHWEWELDKQNLSWKSKLKQAIDEVIKVSEILKIFFKNVQILAYLLTTIPTTKLT